MRFGLQWFALNMAGTLLQSSPRGGNHGHHLAIERREGEDCWTIQCAGYCYHSSERIRSPRRITRTSQDERIGASEDFCCTESALGKNKGPQGCPDQSRQATYISSGISEYQSGNQGTMGKVEGSQEINHGAHIRKLRWPNTQCYPSQSACSRFLSEFSSLVKKGMCRADPS